MSEVTQLFTTIKRQLKLQGKTYRDVAAALGLSEASVKRLLTSDTLGVDRLVEISNMLGFTLPTCWPCTSSPKPSACKSCWCSTACT